MIRKHGLIYFEAIGTSVKTAQDGCGISCDTIELCSFLLDPTTNVAKLQNYIADMKSEAKSAHHDSLVTLNKFREVRNGLNEVSFLML